LDTRTKILSPVDALQAVRRLRDEGRTIKVVTGCFDPVLADHARRVGTLRDDSTALIAVVVDPPRPVLPARARAELVAALAAVDLVVIAGDTPVDDLLARLGAAEIVRSEDADRRLTEGLIHHVRRRHNAV
jgi:bifunctional ADP-heptose synthase (sugar kinase/adenylyltransferase)